MANPTEQRFALNHKLAELKGDRPLIPADELRNELTSQEQKLLLDAKKEYWVDGQIGVDYLRDLEKSNPGVSFDILKNDPRTLPKNPGELEAMLSEKDKATLNKLLGVEGSEITRETREAVVANKKEKWVDLTYTGSVQKSIEAAELRYTAVKAVIDKNDDGIVSGEEARRFAAIITADIANAKRGDEAATQRLGKLDLNGDGKFDKADVSAAEVMVGGACDKLYLDKAIKSLGDQSFPVTDTDGPSGKPLPNSAPKQRPAGKSPI